MFFLQDTSLLCVHGLSRMSPLLKAILKLTLNDKIIIHIT